MNETNAMPQNNTQSGRGSNLKSALKQKFSKLTDEDIQAIERNKEDAPARLERVYGYSHEKAVQEFDAFQEQQTDTASNEKKDEWSSGRRNDSTATGLRSDDGASPKKQERSA